MAEGVLDDAVVLNPDGSERLRLDQELRDGMWPAGGSGWWGWVPMWRVGCGSWWGGGEAREGDGV
jgi:hypothetical protein